MIVWYQQLSKNEQSNVNAQTQLIPSTRHKCLWIVRFILLRQILGHSCLDPPLLVSLIRDLGGLPQRCPIKIILELQEWLMRIYAFLRSQPIDKHEGPSFSANIQHRWAVPSQELRPRPLQSQRVCCLCSIASGRAFKMATIVFCARRLILLAQTHTNHHTSRLDGKIKSSSYNIF